MKKTRQNKKLKPGSDSIKTDRALISALIVKLIIAAWPRKQLSFAESRLIGNQTLATWIAVYFCRKWRAMRDQDKCG
jgi:hypothetical protein